MAKRIKKSTAIVCGLLGALVVGGAIGAIGYVSKGFDKDIINGMLEKKYDYTRVDLTNNYKEAQTLTATTAVTALNYNLDEDLFKTVTITSGAITQENGGLAFAIGTYKLTFQTDKLFDHYRVTAFNGFTESEVENEKGKTETNYLSQVGSISLADSEAYKLPSNADNTLKKPAQEKVSYVTEFKENEITISITGGKVVLTEMEVWNVKDSSIKNTSSAS